ncbi:hypothetical protein HPB47_002209 [Ixodes persulcatus]|uniref:Uncharacterized protein n=1 Tax=Ixodes persulcatus TaxID=34615 RepID=A0AC60PN40_IXOPE|nr:hypothetical protein HPB47_002209 [Ixodes persulcatus]
MPVERTPPKTSRPSEVLSPGRLPFAEDADARASRRAKAQLPESGFLLQKPKKIPTMTTSPVVGLPIARRTPTPFLGEIYEDVRDWITRNEAAHNLARGLTIRAGPSLYPYHGARSARDRLIGYHDITTYYLLSRRIFPQADKFRSIEQYQVWCQPQTGVFPNPATVTHIHPSLYPTSAGPLCGAHANLAHIIWALAPGYLPRSRF